MMPASNMSCQWTLDGLLHGLVPDTALDTPAVRGISADSRRVRESDLFFACATSAQAARAHIEQAARSGACAVVCPPGVQGHGATPCIEVADVRACLGEVAHRFHGRPSRALRVIGVTGTNAKTSVSHFIAHALSRRRGSGERDPCGLIGTLGYGLYAALEAGLLTTPDCICVHERLAAIRAAGATFAVMEVSSHALSQQRVAGVRFDTAVFTNLSRDHLDYHSQMSEYAAAKRRLFEVPGLRRAVINTGDDYGRVLADTLPDTVEVWRYIMADEASPGGEAVLGRILRSDRARLDLAVTARAGSARISAPLLGGFNGANLLAALAGLLACDVSLGSAAAALQGVPAVAGRMQPFGGTSRQALVVVDYSHTPDALANALRALREQAPGPIWCVFGCGGDRDRGKRAQMGRVAATLADRIVVTDDNPRSEDGTRIVEEILGGITATADVRVIRDRAAAITHAVRHALPRHTVLVAGKGHESYQEIAGVRRPFSDAAVVRRVLEAARQ